MADDLRDEIDEALIDQVTQEDGVRGKMLALVYRQITNHIPHRLADIEQAQKDAVATQGSDMRRVRDTQRIHGWILAALLSAVIVLPVVIAAGLAFGLGQ